LFGNVRFDVTNCGMPNYLRYAVFQKSKKQDVQDIDWETVRGKRMG